MAQPKGKSWVPPGAKKSRAVARRDVPPATATERCSHPDELVSLREFARREGVSDTLVRRAITEGRLSKGEDGRISAALVGTPWCERNAKNQAGIGAAGANGGANTANSSPASDRALNEETPTQAASRIADEDAQAGAIPDYSVSLARKEHYLALLRELEFERKSGAVIELDLARSVLFEEFRALRDAWLNWPAKYAALIAADLGLDAGRVTEVLTGYVHKQITSLGEPEGSFGS